MTRFIKALKNTLATKELAPNTKEISQGWTCPVNHVASRGDKWFVELGHSAGSWLFPKDAVDFFYEGIFNLDKIPNPWKLKAKPYIPILVQAFSDQGVGNSPRVLAYAATTICFESSWNPNAVNTYDAAAKTGYPGAGLAQVTWLDNYRAISHKTGIDFVGNPKYMFDPYKALRAKAAFYQLNGLIPYIQRGDYQSAAGIYNAGRAGFRSSYTRNVANNVPLWVPVFS